MRRFSRRGSMMIEAAMMVPVIVLLLVGMVQIARITYVYVELRKVVYSVASYLSTQQGVDFCNPTDLNIAAAVNFGLTGTTDNTQPVFITGLTPEMIQIVPQRYDSLTQTIGTCSCSINGCDVAAGGGAPNYITVAISGYSIQPRIPLLAIDPIPLRPQVKVHYGGI
ncbi:MAG TPA: TadE family protein [Bryobacteraceae bacterium]|nr:TadE family protein [Bryobacteraceae bacterium]